MKNFSDIKTFITQYNIKIIITFILVVLFLVSPKVGFSPMGSEDFRLYKNIVFPFSHANVFHLFCNMYCLWLMREPLYILEGLIISFLCSFLPELTLYGLFTDTPMLPIMGCSGVLFAVIGIKWGRAAKWNEMWKKTWIFFVITAFIPNVAFLFHIYCIVIGYLYGFIKSSYDIWREAKICL